MSRLRGYQEALAREVQRLGNHVVVLQTGAGKTRIAFDLICEALRRQPRKLVYFLAPTVPLATQQHLEFQKELEARHLRVQAGILAGGSKTNLGRCHVVFATPGSVLNRLSAEGMSATSLIVMDEVHHATAKKGDGGHDYSKIATAYAQAKPQQRPKLLGLSASPAENIEQTSRLLQRLEAQLLQVPSGLLAELREAAPSAELIKEPVACSSEFLDFLLAAEEWHRELQRRQSSLPYGGDEFLEVTQEMRQVQQLSSRARCLGWGPASMLGNLQVPEVPQGLRLSWEKLCSHSGDGVSPCFRSLISVLRQHDAAEFRCIVFVGTRKVAWDMVQALKSVAVSQAELGWLLPTCLVGHSDRNDEDGTMTIAEQTKILDDFRKGFANVMVATSVAEEGIDIPCCNLVVRMEPPRTVISLIQARGRARYHDSRFVIMCCDDDEQQLVSQVEKRRTDMQQKLRELSPCTVAVNSWNTPGPAAREPILAFDAEEGRRDWDPETARRVKLEELEVDIDMLFPTQATVRKTFTNGNDVLQTMVGLVRDPEDIVKLPLMWVSRGSAALLGRRSPFGDIEDKEVFLSADNRRCFLLKVIAPLCDLRFVRVARMGWTPEMDAKLMQCPQTDAWATDQETIEEVRNQVVMMLAGNPELSVEPLVEPRGKYQRLSEAPRAFDRRVDFISKLNVYLQQSRRPNQHEANIAKYMKLPEDVAAGPGNFRCEVNVEDRVFRGAAQSKMMIAKQSAAHAACLGLGVI